MEGREQKHQKIAKYSENTTYHNRWPLIFRHEFIQLVYLRENGYDTVKYRKRHNTYLPNCSSFDSCSECGLKKTETYCELCSSIPAAKVRDLLQNLK